MRGKKFAATVPSTIFGVVLIALSIGFCLIGCGTDTTAAGTDSEDAYSSPLSEYMGFDQTEVDFGDEEAAQAYFENEQRRVNEAVVACMATEGFEFIPEDDGTMVFGSDTDSEGIAWGTDEWVAKYGFGVSTQSFPQEMVGPELVGMDESIYHDEPVSDPNQAYRDGLSEADRQAFDEALYGTDPGPDFSEDMPDEEMDAAIREWEENREPSGCYEQAQMDSVAFGGQHEFFEEFGDEMEALYEQVESHPRIVVAEREVAECVAEQGLVFTGMNQVYDEFNQQMEPLWEQAYSGPGMEITEEAVETMSTEELEALYAPEELSDEAKATLGEIQEEEIELAIAVNECGGGFDANADVYREVQAELEQQFIDENRERLEEFKAARPSE